MGKKLTDFNASMESTNKKRVSAVGAEKVYYTSESTARFLFLKKVIKWCQCQKQDMTHFLSN